MAVQEAKNLPRGDQRAILAGKEDKKQCMYVEALLHV